jgi:hypothetical protein
VQRQSPCHKTCTAGARQEVTTLHGKLTRPLRMA